jgi:DNA-damage-inducible protein D
MSVPTDLSAAPAYRATMEKLDKIKHISPRGTDYWRAREIYEVLGYAEWRNFEDVLQRARDACVGVEEEPSNHFGATTKMVPVGSGASRRVADVFLSRTACYLVAMNGDPSKPEIAAAQAYFAVQTRRMELRDQEDAMLAQDERRLELRSRVKTSFRKVSGVAKEAGVRNQMQPVFHDARYQGLYGASMQEVKRIKDIPDGDNLLDRAGPLELSAHDFQMNLAAEVISREVVRGERRAIDTNRAVAARVRSVIEDSGSPLPEALAIEAPIKVVEKRVRAIRKTLPKPS